MGEFRPYESYGADFIEDFFRRARFTCKLCEKECRLVYGRLMAEETQVFALGDCSECGHPQKFDVTHVWREE